MRRRHEAGRRRDARSGVDRADADRRAREAFRRAEPLVDRWIDDAIMLGPVAVAADPRQGHGAARQRLQEYLKAHPFVQNVRYGNADEGGGGVTVFELRSPTA